MTTPITELRTKERTKQTGEVFTPKSLVLELLNKLPANTWQPNINFLDNSCGHGNFLVEIVKRKIEKGLTKFQAIKSTYGIDLMTDNVEECRERILKIVGDTPKYRKIVEHHIVCHDALIGWDYENWCKEKTKEELRDEKLKEYFDY